MSKQNRISRRRFIKTAGVGAAGLLLSRQARAARKTLKIVQWNHFVPAYDKWFNETYVKEWEAKNDTEVIVDNIGATGLPARAAAEAAAGRGHDLFGMLSPPAIYETSVVDMTDVFQECESKYGKPIPLATKDLDGAKKFLVDYIGNFRQAFLASQFYNFPCFWDQVPDIVNLLESDTKSKPAGKYKVFADCRDWTTNVGYPGYSTAAIDETFSTWRSGRSES